MTSEDEDSTNSEDSETDSIVTPRGDKVTRSFLSHGVSSKAQVTVMISSINQYIIRNLLCEVALANGINTYDVPKGENEEKNKREATERGSEVTARGSDQAKKKVSEDKCKRNVEDAKKDGSNDDGDNKPLRKRVRLAG